MSSYNIKEVGLPAKNLNNLSYAGPLLNIVPLLGPNRAPTSNNYNFPLACFWLNNNELATSPDSQGDLWYMAKKSNYVAKWIKLSGGGSGPLLQFTPSSGSVVFPSSTGNVNMIGSGITVTGSTETLTFGLEGGGIAVQQFTPTSGIVVIPNPTNGNVNMVAGTGITITGTSETLTFALAGGGTAIESITVDAFTAPGTNPVLPNAGTLTITGGQVAAGTIGANALRTDSLAANTFTIQVQRAAAASSSSVNNAGILSADASQFNIDSNGWLQLKASSEPSQLTNIGIKYSAGTFTVCAADGSALSATNPGIVWLQSKATPGTLKRYLVTADQTFTDGAAGSFATMRWGLFASVNWPNDLPFFIYGVGDDTETNIAFMISRIPNRNSSPVAASIGKAGALVNNGQFDFYSLENITVANYESNPCMLLGAFRMTFVGATNSWLVTTLDSSDGIGIYHEQTLFTFPGGVFGAAANTYIQNNGGTAPVFASNYYSYKIYVTGECYIDMTSIGNTATDGAGAVQTNVTMPFEPVISSNPGVAKVFNPTASIAYLIETSTVTTNTFALIPVSNTATGNVLENGDFTDGDRQISTSFLYTIADS